MNEWECGVCGYLHKEGDPPEKCPICEAPQKMFIDKSVNEKDESAGAGDVEELKSKRWRCTVCGYIHEGEEPPEKCPVCDAPAVMFVEIDTFGNDLSVVPENKIEPLESTHDKDVAETAAPEKAPSTILDKIGSLVLKFHLHPITVHFPNGILPAAVAFLALAVFLKIAFMEQVAYYNFVFVLIMLPVVLFTGYLEWQKRYRGIKTAVFIVKIICSLIVLAAVNVLVFWRVIDPQVATEGSTYQLIYFGIAGAALAAAGIAGHLGGKLVFGSRGH